MLTTKQIKSSNKIEVEYPYLLGMLEKIYWFKYVFGRFKYGILFLVLVKSFFPFRSLMFLDWPLSPYRQSLSNLWWHGKRSFMSQLLCHLSQAMWPCNQISISGMEGPCWLDSNEKAKFAFIWFESSTLCSSLSDKKENDCPTVKP